MLTLFGSAVSAIGAVFGAVKGLFGWLKDRTMIAFGYNKHALEQAEDINKLHEQAAVIDAEPPMSPGEQLDWMRRQNGKND